jgi:tetratricopeptide (TPR) repeat protein
LIPKAASNEFVSVGDAKGNASLMRARNLSRIFWAGGACFFLSSCAAGGQQVRQTSHAYSAYMMGLLSDRLGSVDEAIGHYQRSRDLDQDVPALYLQLGLDHLRLQDFPRAAAAFEQALRLDPQDVDARYVLALVYVQLNDYKKAAQEYEKLLGREAAELAEKTQLRRILSQLYFLQDDWNAAGEQSAAILRLNPLDESALYFQAVLAHERGDIEEAVEGFREILRHYPGDTRAMNSLAYLYAEEDRDLQEALALAQRAVSEEPGIGPYLDTLGWVYFKIGETDRAIEFLERADSLMFDPTILNHLGEAYLKKGMPQKAKERWTSSLNLDPTQKDIRKRLQQLE